MSFFKQLSALLSHNTSALFTVSLSESNEVVVTISPLLKNGNPINPGIKPLTLAGTPEELDDRFFETLNDSAFSKAISLAVNLEEFNQSVEDLAETKLGESQTEEQMIEKMRLAMHEFAKNKNPESYNAEQVEISFAAIINGAVPPMKPSTKKAAAPKELKAPKPPKPKSHSDWMKEGRAAMIEADKLTGTGDGKAREDAYLKAVECFSEANKLEPEGKSKAKLALARQWYEKMKEINNTAVTNTLTSADDQKQATPGAEQTLAQNTTETTPVVESAGATESTGGDAGEEPSWE